MYTTWALLTHNSISMYSKQNLVASLSNEFRVIRHLITKMPEGAMDYKPTEKQRTTLELLQYLSIVAPATIDCVYQGDTKAFMPYVEISKTVTADNFSEIFDRHEKLAHEILEKFTDETLHEKINLFNMGEMTKGVYLVETILKWIVAYKMQLFLYIKAAGNTSIGTSNLWGGMDTPPKA